MAAFGRQQAAFADETASFFMDVHLTMAQFRALVMIRRFGRQSGRELAGRLLVTPGSRFSVKDLLLGTRYLRRVPYLPVRWLQLVKLFPAVVHHLIGA